MSKLGTHTIITVAIVILATCKNCFGNGIPPPPSPQQNDQYIHEKQEVKADQIPDEQDPYHLLNDFKIDQHPYPIWNPYHQGSFAQPNRFFNYFNYPNPIVLPFPVLIQPDYLYPSSYPMADDYEDPLSRANTRRPSPYRNSPIYYVRVPPSPYMFIPGLGYTSQPPSFAPNFSPIMHYNPMPALPYQPAISPMINLPLNLLANGKPTNVYQLDPNEIQSQYQQFAPPPRPYRPPYQPYSPDSKITHLKRPFIFNGKPEEIYFLPNNFNSMHPAYQPPLQNYY